MTLVVILRLLLQDVFVWCYCAVQPKPPYLFVITVLVILTMMPVDHSENSDPDHDLRLSRLTTIEDPVLLVILISTSLRPFWAMTIAC